MTSHTLAHRPPAAIGNIAATIAATTAAPTTATTKASTTNRKATIVAASPIFTNAGAGATLTHTGADTTQLQQHLAHCMAACSRLHRLLGAAEAVDAFLSPRFVSTLLALALTAAAVTWLAV